MNAKPLCWLHTYGCQQLAIHLCCQWILPMRCSAAEKPMSCIRPAILETNPTRNCRQNRYAGSCAHGRKPFFTSEAGPSGHPLGKWHTGSRMACAHAQGIGNMCRQARICTHGWRSIRNTYKLVTRENRMDLQFPNSLQIFISMFA